MIRDLTQTLRSLLTQSAVPAELAGAQIVFDRPTDQFNPTQATVDLFLYDIRENLELRSNESTVERQNGQVTISRPPLRVDCSYLVTAWPGGVSGDELALQEHRLLSQILQVFSRYSTIPNNFLQGSLANQEPPLPMVTARANGLKEPAEFWTSLGTQLRASIGVTVTIGIPVFAPVTSSMVTTKVAGFDLGKGVEETLIQIGGQVQAQTQGGIESVPNALVDILDAGLQTRTDKKGRYLFVQVPSGTHTIRVVAEGFEPHSQSLIVPGRSEDYQIILTPL